MSDTDIDIASDGATYNALKDCKDVWAAKKLPGVVIFVHGVNSDGEWYEDTEAGLCKGLNTRLRRDDAHVAHPPGVGKLRAASYRPELTARGFIDDKLSADTFVEEDEHSPVIRFRWGYRASKRDMAALGENLWLNEKLAWGGGPFANGCTHPADCFTAGLSDEVFAFIRAQDLNSAPGREVYRAPHRAYYAHAAYRLARLVALIRDRQPDVPITILSHSQGTIVAMLSAFVGDRDLKGAGAADCYHLFNSPFNLTLEGVALDSDLSVQQRNGGRVSEAARFATLREFVALVAKRKEKRQSDAMIDRLVGNDAPQDGSSGCTAAAERAADRENFGRVFNHCNPADQVVSVVTVQGIGWKGIAKAEWERLPADTRAHLRQRVWADGVESTAQPTAWKVGMEPARERGEQGREYSYWRNHWRAQTRAGREGFWFPPPPRLLYQFRASVADPARARASGLGALIAGVLLAPLTSAVPVYTSATPKKNHVVLDNGPRVPEPIAPVSRVGGRFDQGLAPEHEQLARRAAVDDPNDPYHRAREDGTLARLERDTQSDARASQRTQREGTEREDAALRYEHNARVRMASRREAKGLEHAPIGAETEGEREARLMRAKAHENAADQYDGKNAQADRFMSDHYDGKRISFLLEGASANATDHSSILMQPLHAEKVIAYDVAMGYSTLSAEDWRLFRKVADWRWIPEAGLPRTIRDYRTYFSDGEFSDMELDEHPEYSTESLNRLRLPSERVMRMLPDPWRDAP